MRQPSNVLFSHAQNKIADKDPKGPADLQQIAVQFSVLLLRQVFRVPPAQKLQDGPVQQNTEVLCLHHLPNIRARLTSAVLFASSKNAKKENTPVYIQQ